MRILLIVPRLSLDTAPLGVGYMAAFLKQYGYVANIVCTGNMDDQTFTKIIKKQKPDLIGFTAMTLWIKEVYRMASLVKKLMPNCKIVCGGVHPTALPILTLNECGLLDAVVIGEAEETFLQLQERGLNEKCGLDVTTRPDTLNGEVIKMLAKSGCSKISLWTVNSGDDRILSNTRRKYTTKHIEDAVNQCRKQGVESFVGFTFGNPGETEETAWNTIQFAKKLKANGYWFGINRPFPGSELYQIGLREGYDIQGRWDEYEMRPPHPTKLPTPRTRLSPTTLFELINTATKEVKK